MTSNARVVVIGAGLAGVRLARRRTVRCVGGRVRSVEMVKMAEMAEMADRSALDADLVVPARGVHPRVGLARAGEGAEPFPGSPLTAARCSTCSPTMEAPHDRH